MPGLASEELARESADAGDTGAVPAYRDEAGVWQYVPADQRDAYRARGVEVLTVWVES